MASYHFIISTDDSGSNAVTFPVNPLDLTGMFQERAYTTIPIIEGTPILQHPTNDTRIKSFSFDLIPNERTSLMEFVFGTDESDTDSLYYWKKLDSDALLTTYYLTIPNELKLFRPFGYREEEYIPIRIEDVVAVPEVPQGRIRWKVTVYFRVIPAAELV